MKCKYCGFDPESCWFAYNVCDRCENIRIAGGDEAGKE